MGGMARGTARPQGDGRRVGPGVDMSRPCEGCHARFQHHKQPGECPIPMPWDPSVQGQGTRTGLPAARLGRVQGRHRWTGAAQKNCRDFFLRRG